MVKKRTFLSGDVLVRYAAVLSAVIVSFLFCGTCVGQTAPSKSVEMPWAQYLKKYPGLDVELSQLMTKLQRDVQFPAPRNQSRILPLLPKSTQFYIAVPNYGDASHQALSIFRNELTQSAVLRDWWKNEIAENGPKVEDALDRVYQLSEFLGEEIVISGSTDGPHGPGPVMIAEIKKPGLKNYLQQMSNEFASQLTSLQQSTSAKLNPTIRILEPQELATAKDSGPSQIIVLVRPDFVIAGFNIASLKSFNAELGHGGQSFVSSSLGGRLSQSYKGGTTVIGGADLQSILKQIPAGNEQAQMMFQRSGLADVKYLVWEHKSAAGQSLSQAELTFNGPRRGVASWLAAPAPLGGLDFVSPKAIVVTSFSLKNLGEIFDDIQAMSGDANSNMFAAQSQMEQALQLNLKDDLLSQLSGEITIELDSVAAPDPVWKAILRVSDPAHLQRTISKLLDAAQMNERRSQDAGVTYHAVRVPSPRKSISINYAFVDGYLIVGSSHEAAAEAVRLHATGESLAKSPKFLESMPSHSLSASGIFYEDPIAMMALSMRQASPEMAQLLSQVSSQSGPIVMAGYADERALREVSTNAGVDAGVVLVGAAIAIPNLLRARTAANEASAVSMVRTVVTAEVSYSATYPARGYARTLASLGEDQRGVNATSPEHAGLIYLPVEDAGCWTGKWCARSGFRFAVSTSCKKQKCDEYVVTGTPVTSNDGMRNFCSTSDGVVRFKIGSPLELPVSVAECQTWMPLH